MEEHPPEILPLARQGGVGTFPEGLHRRTGHGVAHGGRQPRQGAPTRGRGRRRERGNRPHKRGRNTKIHLACDSNGLPVRVSVTAGTVADCTQALPLIDGLDGEAVLADRGYDTNEIVEGVQKRGMEVVIPPKCNRKTQRAYDKYPYKLRNLVENAFLKMKDGGVLRRGMRSVCRPTWPSCKYGAHSCGLR